MERDNEFEREQERHITGMERRKGKMTNDVIITL